MINKNIKKFKIKRIRDQKNFQESLTRLQQIKILTQIWKQNQCYKKIEYGQQNIQTF